MIEVNNLTKQYQYRNKNGKKLILDVVKNLSFSLDTDCSYSLIGESGSGKSTLARLLAAIEPPTKGDILFENKSIIQMSKRELRLQRANFQLVLQDAKSALDPRKTIYDNIAEPIRNLKKENISSEKLFVNEITQKVELSKKLLSRFPNELSGGQQKRVCIARAMCLAPKFVIFDESVSGLDVTVQKKILDLLLQLRDEYHSTYLFITHDIDVALYMANDILVMKSGEIIEKIQDIKSYDDFHHEYSKSLIRSLPPKTPYER